MLLAYPWPGNVRELAAVIERAALLGDGKRLDLATALGSLPVTAPTPPAVLRFSTQAPAPAFATLAAKLTEHITAALTRTQGQIEGKAGAAALLGINPHTLRAKMRKLGIPWKQYRTATAVLPADPQARRRA